jgi:hypothetical protein
MDGPYDFSSDAVDRVVTLTKAGNFALGTTDTKGVFIVNYVGRSDGDVKTELKSKPAGTTHQKFKFSYADSSKEAFEKECRNYHDFRPPENAIHPDRPSGTSYQCPVPHQ